MFPKKAICERKDNSVDKCCGDFLITDCPEAAGGWSTRKGIAHEETTESPQHQK